MAPVEVKSRTLVGPGPTDLVEQRPVEPVERWIEVLVEAEPTTFVEPRSTIPVKQRCRECPTCDYKSEEAARRRVCPEYGGMPCSAGTGRD